MAMSLHSAFLAPPTCALTDTPPRRSAATSSASRNFVTCSSQSRGDATSATPSLACSRREVLGMGGMLALMVNPLQAAAAAAAAEQATTCGKYNVTASGLEFCDSELGTGIPASKGMLIKAHYSGRLENGFEFDSSYKRRKPLTFRVGVGEVIRGWDQGIVGSGDIPAMQAGGKRTLRIPANLGYGERGAGCRLGSCLIPPNSVLIFDVEFVGKA